MNIVRDYPAAPVSIDNFLDSLYGYTINLVLGRPCGEPNCFSARLELTHAPKLLIGVPIPLKPEGRGSTEEAALKDLMGNINKKMGRVSFTVGTSSGQQTRFVCPPWPPFDTNTTSAVLERNGKALR